MREELVGVDNGVCIQLKVAQELFVWCPRCYVELFIHVGKCPVCREVKMGEGEPATSLVIVIAHDSMHILESQAPDGPPAKDEVFCIAFEAGRWEADRAQWRVRTICYPRMEDATELAKLDIREHALQTSQGIPTRLVTISRNVPSAVHAILLRERTDKIPGLLVDLVVHVAACHTQADRVANVQFLRDHQYEFRRKPE